jgi:hypothetical protein
VTCVTELEHVKGTGKWRQPNVPHKGWTCIGIEDLEAPDAICEMCEVQEIRYVHEMEHPDYGTLLHVGCICAGHMEEDLVGARKRETDFKERLSRRVRWLSRTWRTSMNGNSFLNTHDGFNIVVFKQRGGGWGARYIDKGTGFTRFSQRFYASRNAAKLAAFDAITYHKRKKQEHASMNISFNLNRLKPEKKISVPISPKRKPAVYMAGKIAPDDWRTRIFGDRWAGVQYHEDQAFDLSYVIAKPEFDYVGPFFIACDHCCGHGPASHGMGASGDKQGGCASIAFGNDNDTAGSVFAINYQRMQKADVIFAYINETDCHGTLIELGMAFAMGKRIVVAFGTALSDYDRKELWMARKCASMVTYGTPENTWNWFLRFGLRSDPSEAA